MKKTGALVLILACIMATAVKEGQSSTILLIGPPLYSLCSQIASLGKTLSDRGHTVWAFVADAQVSEKCFGNTNVKLLKYKVDRDELAEVTEISSSSHSSLVDVYKRFSRFTQSFCSFIFGDSAALKTLSGIRFDMSIVFTMLPMRCMLFIPYKLGIPFVSFSAIHSWSDYGKPFHPVMENHPLTYSPQMTFSQRLKSTIFNIVFPLVGHWAFSYKANNTFVPDMSYVEYSRLINKAELFIQDDEVFLFGAFPTMPNIIHTGGFFRRTSKTLPRHLADFYRTTASQTHGVILTSFGSVLHSVTNDFNKELLDCFTSLQQTVMWKLNDEAIEQQLSKTTDTNIMTSDWLPQNDLLGQNKTVLFISHCGRKSFYEALHHGVPLICIPFFGDQPSVAVQVAYHGIGIKLDKDKVTSDTMCDTVREIMSNKSYRENMRRVSSIYHDLHPEAAEVVASKAIEHVIKYGGQHLRPQSMDLYIISHLMLDVWISLCFVLTMIVVFPLYCCCRCCRSRSSRRENSKEKTQ